MSSIKAPNYRDVVPACCYNCEESTSYVAGGVLQTTFICQKFGHNIDDAGLKICDAYKVGI